MALLARKNPPPDPHEQLVAAKARAAALLQQQAELAERSLDDPQAGREYADVVVQMAAAHGEVLRIETAIASLDRKQKAKLEARQFAEQRALRERVRAVIEQRMAPAKRFEDALGKAVAAFRELVELSDRAYTAFPNGPPDVLGGAHVVHMVAAEMARLGLAPQWGPEARKPSLPGPRVSFEFADDPGRMSPLTVAIEQDNRHAIDLIEGRQ